MPTPNSRNAASPSIWGEALDETYTLEGVGEVPEYVAARARGLIRKRFPTNQLVSSEIITALTKVTYVVQT